jgi:hypothetical protein
MNVTTASPFPEPDPDRPPETESLDSTLAEFTDEGPSALAPAEAVTLCFDATVAVFDGPGDTTIRPVRPSLRPYLGRYPRPEPPPAAD